MLSRHFWSVALLWVAVPAGAANLVPDPGFDDGIAGWIVGPGHQLEHDPLDELGAQTSGSLRLIAGLGSGIGPTSICGLPVTAGTRYAMGASVFIPFGQPPVFARARVDWYSNADELGNGTTAPSTVDFPGAWGTIQQTEVAPAGAQSACLSLEGVPFEVSPRIPFELNFDNAFFVEDESCVGTQTTLCLTDDRFRITAEWRTKDGTRGFGRAVDLTSDSGYFWFFNAANVELVVKVLDACPTQFDRFWVFAAGLTNVEVLIRIRDTTSDTERTYANLLETPFAPIQDTNAFATCP
jgi:hypothetical protein